MMAVPVPSSQTILVEARLSSQAIEGCARVPGFSAGDIDQDVKYVLFGGSFGTNEFVTQFGNVVCTLSETRPLTVALEWPTRYAQALTDYINDPRDDADKALLNLAVWDKGELDDGRSSQSIFKLIQLIRRLRLAHRDIELTTCVPSPGDQGFVPGADQNSSEAGMANQLKTISGKGRLVIALMFSLQASKKTALDPTKVFPPLTIDPAGDRLPKDQVISIHFESKGGMAWGWLGPHKLPIYGGGGTLWSRYADTVEGRDGRLFVGGPVTASPPVK